MNPAGKYGHALMLDFPNPADRKRFLDLKREGVVSSRARIGGNIEIHGGGKPDSDWTDGCISLADEDMRDLYRRSYPGMPVTIVGTSRLASTLQERTVVSRQ
jgi:murein L,D-transpeptidase YafK